MPPLLVGARSPPPLLGNVVWHSGGTAGVVLKGVTDPQAVGTRGPRAAKASELATSGHRESSPIKNPGDLGRGRGKAAADRFRSLVDNWRKLKCCHRSSCELLGLRISPGGVNGVARRGGVVDAIDEKNVEPEWPTAPRPEPRAAPQPSSAAQPKAA